jgi:1,2-diacylglycerol 3-alpha-glucosyltransferase
MQIGEYIDSYSPVIDGVVTCVKNYAYWLNQKHGNCYVAAPRCPGYEDTDPFSVYRFTSVPVPKKPPYRFGVSALDYRYHKAMAVQYPQLVHAHSPFTAGWDALRFAKRRDIPIVATFHSKFYDDFLEAVGSPFLARQALKPIVRFFTLADHVWSVNEATAETLRSYGYKGEIEVMPNGVDMATSAPEPELQARVRAQLQLSPDKPLLLFVGQQVNQKNIPMLLEALAIIKRKGVDFQMLSVGEGKDRVHYRELIQKLGLTDSVRLPGPIRDRDMLKGLYQCADLLTFPSLYDNAPLVVKEAAAMACPALLVKGSNAAAEASMDNVNSFLCDEATPESIAQRIVEALSDREKLLEVGQTAQKTLVQPWEKIVDRVAARYRQIIIEHQPRRRRPQKIKLRVKFNIRAKTRG